MKTMQKNHFWNILLVVVFCLIIFVPFLLTNRVYGANTEKRTLASLPKFRTAEGYPNFEFPHQFESWFNDHFGLRRFFVQADGFVNFSVLKVSTSDDVVIGKDGWLYLAKTVPVQTNANTCNPEQLSLYKQKFAEIKAYLDARNIKLLVTFTPLKTRLYPQYFPDYYYPVNAVSRLEQLKGIFADLGIAYADLENGLRQHLSEDQLLYLKTDEHWNSIGAFYGYQTIADKLKDFFPQLKPANLDDYSLEKIPVTRGSTINRLGLDLHLDDSYRFTPQFKLPYEVVTNDYNDEFYHYIKTQSTDSKSELPKLIMLHDSFTEDEDPLERWGLWRFISLHFSQAEYYWVYDFDKVKAKIEEEKPDVVIIEAFELYLDDLI